MKKRTAIKKVIIIDKSEKVLESFRISVTNTVTIKDNLISKMRRHGHFSLSRTVIFGVQN